MVDTQYPSHNKILSYCIKTMNDLGITLDTHIVLSMTLKILSVATLIFLKLI
ncbi:hypothetical protein SCAPIOD10369 [Staphylococcus capitis]|nr:hypothetical protein CR01_50041 [Staphylococcus capitis CR01]CQD26038.1 hypothetical protein SCAPIOD10369 [Staphylococcus capitis]CQD27422.1 hypothetical protein SCAPIOD170046 [Staphylococcus capitis]CQD31264.1 hypothetical protein SCAPIOD180022 [Staphylococcus capitis]CRN11686.1 hypothetical protein BN151730112 [Staphylococcus capitis]